MKKIFVIFSVLLLSTSILFSGINVPSIVPEGASWRIDIYPENIKCHGKWVSISTHYDEEGMPKWGQGQCQPSVKHECHCWDWVTWWYGIANIPSPPKDWESIFGTYDEFPTSYNPETGQYERE